MQCCSNARSSYFKVIPSRFLSPPIPVAQTTEGLKAPDKHEDSCSYKFPSMFVSQILKPDDILPTAKNCFKIPPYDLYCPSVESCLTDRVCKVCNMYFDSQVMLRAGFCAKRTKRPLRAANSKGSPILGSYFFYTSTLADRDVWNGF